MKLVLCSNLQFPCHLLLLLLLSFCVLLEASRHLQTNLQSENGTRSQPYRTGYHFQPHKNWMNDPNGPMLYKQLYHLFYQYNPLAAVPGNMVWGHVTSKDLVNWDSQPIAITPSQESDINGCWSGSTTFLAPNSPVILYTGINRNNHQTQNLALPQNLSDPYLKLWNKSKYNPLIYPTPQNHIEPTSFRDPTTAWKPNNHSLWRFVVGSKNNSQGMAILYKSSDFVNWTESDAPLYSSENSGMWECPDFYPVRVGGLHSGADTSATGSGFKHVLKVSLAERMHDYYLVGDYDAIKDRFIPMLKRDAEDEWSVRHDYGKFYASKTFFDSDKKQRILWGWVSESSTQIEDITKGWSGIQAIPRMLWLDKEGKQLVHWPIKEIETLRGKKVELSRTILEGGTKLAIQNFTAAEGDVEVIFNLTSIEKAQEWNTSWNKKNPESLCSQRDEHGGFGLYVLASKGLEEFTSVFFRVFREQTNRVVLMCSDQSSSSQDKDTDKPVYGAFINMDSTQTEQLSLRTLIDRSVVESFGGGGKVCITARVYPTMAINDNAYLYAFNNGSDAVQILSLTAWSMNKAQINRLLNAL